MYTHSFKLPHNKMHLHKGTKSLETWILRKTDKYEVWYRWCMWWRIDTKKVGKKSRKSLYLHQHPPPQQVRQDVLFLHCASLPPFEDWPPHTQHRSDPLSLVSVVHKQKFIYSWMYQEKYFFSNRLICCFSEEVPTDAGGFYLHECNVISTFPLVHT